ALASVSPWSGMLWDVVEDLVQKRPDVESAFTLGYFDAVCQGNEGNLTWEPLPRGVRRIEGNNGRSGYGCPYFILRNEVTGECAMLALAWSTNWYAEFVNDPWINREGLPDHGYHLSFRMGPKGPAPLRVIAPGETITSPETHLALLHGSTDSCVQAMHAHMRASVAPPRPAGKEMYTIAGRVVEEPGEWILREIDIAHEMGVEAFMVDAGWYGDSFAGWWERRGDWNEGDWIPGGLAACRQRAHDHGMLFGLWMEPEAIGPKSRLLREHPDWVMRRDGDKPVSAYGSDISLDLANPEAAAYLTSEILRVVREHKLDFFKLDYNVDVEEGGQRQRDGFAESEAWRHCETLYGAFDAVRREHPDVALENCSSGGGRNDLGMLSRFHYACESDFSKFPRSIRAINGLSLFIPPESLCYYHNHIWHAHEMADLDTHLRVTLFVQTIFVGFGAQDADRSTEYFAKTRRYIKLAREFTEPILGGQPTVFHHTPDIGVLQPADWCVLEYAAKDRSAAYAGVFRLQAPVPGTPAARDGQEVYLFRPKGLDVGRRYQVTLDNSGMTFERDGAALMFDGIPVRLDQACTSELLLFRAL
ncbi:MAG: alpha-galactosidase, partial [Anaerolineae bacterium]